MAGDLDISVPPGAPDLRRASSGFERPESEASFGRSVLQDPETRTRLTLQTIAAMHAPPDVRAANVDIDPNTHLVRDIQTKGSTLSGYPLDRRSDLFPIESAEVDLFLVQSLKDEFRTNYATLPFQAAEINMLIRSAREFGSKRALELVAARKVSLLYDLIASQLAQCPPVVGPELGEAFQGVASRLSENLGLRPGMKGLCESLARSFAQAAQQARSATTPAPLSNPQLKYFAQLFLHLLRFSIIASDLREDSASTEKERTNIRELASRLRDPVETFTRLERVLVDAANRKTSIKLPGENYALPDQPIRIGLGSNAGGAEGLIRIRSIRMSRNHGYIDKYGPIFSFVTDLGSSNGTKLNGEKITTKETSIVLPGDKLEAAKAEILQRNSAPADLNEVPFYTDGDISLSLKLPEDAIASGEAISTWNSSSGEVPEGVHVLENSGLFGSEPKLVVSFGDPDCMHSAMGARMLDSWNSSQAARFEEEGTASLVHAVESFRANHRPNGRDPNMGVALAETRALDRRDIEATLEQANLRRRPGPVEDLPAPQGPRPDAPTRRVPLPGRGDLSFTPAQSLDSRRLNGGEEAPFEIEIEDLDQR